MPTVYQYQNNQALMRAVSQDLLLSMQTNNLIFTFFPIVLNPTTKLKWTILDNYKGLMALRGLGGEPTSISLVGANTYEAKPGYFGEFATLDEEELTLREGSVMLGADQNATISIQDMIMEADVQLMTRYYNRLVQMGWDLLNTGTLSISLPKGGIGYVAQYAQQTSPALVPWRNRATATPYQDLANLQPRFGRGSSTNFGQAATAYMNSRTLQDLLFNRNPDDLYGKRIGTGSTLTSLGDINNVLLLAGAPKIVVEDDGYVSDDGTYKLNVPDGTVHVMGARGANETMGVTQLTKNANNPGNAPGVYAHIEDFTQPPYRRVPPRIIVHRGFNGGHAVTRPKQHIKMIVGAEADYA